eukprot:466413_1
MNDDSGSDDDLGSGSGSGSGSDDDLLDPFFDQYQADEENQAVRLELLNKVQSNIEDRDVRARDKKPLIKFKVNSENMTLGTMALVNETYGFSAGAPSEELLTKVDGWTREIVVECPDKICTVKFQQKVSDVSQLIGNIMNHLKMHKTCKYAISLSSFLDSDKKKKPKKKKKKK